MRFVIEEIFLLLLIFAQFYFVLGIRINGWQIEFTNATVPFQNILWLTATIIFFIVIYFGISVRDKMVAKVHKDFSKVIFGTAKQKFFGMNREVVALLFAEFVFAILIATSIYVYLDPDVNFVPWPFNYISFFALLAVGLFLFSKTKPFTGAIYGDSFVRKKVVPAERLFPTRRITNNKRQTIRVKHRKNK